MTSSLQTIVLTTINLGMAFVLGAIIGLERQVRQRTAGLRTNVLVCLGASLFVSLAVRFHALHGGSPGVLQVVAYVVSGVGFLGAGVIMREGGSVRGLNTAATLWGSAAVGSAAGAALYIEAIMGTAFVLAANTLLRPAVNWINHRPINIESIEATYSLHIMALSQDRKNAIDLLSETLEAAQIPISDIDVKSINENQIEIEATLLPSSLDGKTLDLLVEKIRPSSIAQQVFWCISTTD